MPPIVEPAKLLRKGMRLNAATASGSSRDDQHQQINEAYERLLKSDVKYRFVIDKASLK